MSPCITLSLMVILRNVCPHSMQFFPVIQWLGMLCTIKPHLSKRKQNINLKGFPLKSIECFQQTGLLLEADTDRKIETLVQVLTLVSRKYYLGKTTVESNVRDGSRSERRNQNTEMTFYPSAKIIQSPLWVTYGISYYLNKHIRDTSCPGMKI